MYYLLLTLFLTACGELPELVPSANNKLWIWRSSLAQNADQFFLNDSLKYKNNDFALSTFQGRLLLYRDCSKKCFPLTLEDQDYSRRCIAEIPYELKSTENKMGKEIIDNTATVSLKTIMSEITCGLNLQEGLITIKTEAKCLISGEEKTYSCVKLNQAHFSEPMVFIYPYSQLY